MDLVIALRTREQMWVLRGDEYQALAALVPLVLEPETMSEFQAGLERLPAAAEAWRNRAVAASDLGVLESASSWCLIDLAAHCVLAHDWELPQFPGGYFPDDDLALPENERRTVWIHIPPEWESGPAGAHWQEKLEQRRQSIVPPMRIDTRAVLFGPPLHAFLAKRVLATVRKGGRPPDEDAIYTSTKAIHVDWLMTSREDLGGRCPREVLFERQDFLDAEIQQRSFQWSIERKPPDPLSRDSASYRWAGFTSLEFIVYFDLVRALLAHAWTLVDAEPQMDQEELAALLPEYQDHWLTTPQSELDYHTPPGELMELARRRMPITEEMPLDDNCPICQEMAKHGDTPTFIGYDGHHLYLEDEFAFSLSKDRIEWEVGPAKWNEPE